MILLFVFSLIWIAIGCIAGRMDGGGIIKTPELIERLLVMCGFVIALAPSCGIYSLLALLGTFGIATGHGQYFPSLKVKALKPEYFDFIVKPLFGQDPRSHRDYKPIRGMSLKEGSEQYEELHTRMKSYGINKLYWRNVFGMFITGALVGLPAAALGFIFAQPLTYLFLLTGLVKSVAYIVGEKFFNGTEAAEYINGGLRYLLCLLVLLGGLDGWGV